MSDNEQSPPAGRAGAMSNQQDDAHGYWGIGNTGIGGIGKYGKEQRTSTKEQAKNKKTKNKD